MPEGQGGQSPAPGRPAARCPAVPSDAGFLILTSQMRLQSPATGPAQAPHGRELRSRALSSCLGRFPVLVLALVDSACPSLPFMVTPPPPDSLSGLWPRKPLQRPTAVPRVASPARSVHLLRLPLTGNQYAWPAGRGPQKSCAAEGLATWALTRRSV